MSSTSEIVPPPPRPARGWLWPGMFAIGLALLVLAVVYILFVKGPPPKTLILASGGKDGEYYRYAEEYAKSLKKDGIEVEVLSTKGSVENLDLLLDPDSKVSVALVQGGIADKQKCESLMSLGSLYREPLWIFQRGDKPITQLGEMAGKKIAVGPEGSGTRGIAEMLLKANGVDSTKAVFERATGVAAAELLIAGKIDAAFFVAGIEAVYIRQLVKAPEVRVVELVQFDAYIRRFKFLSQVSIPPGLIDLKDNIPAKEIRLVAPTATLVARKTLHPALISLLVAAMENVHSPGDLISSPGEFPSKLYNDLPMSEEAEHFLKNGPPFLQRILPFWLASFVDRTKLMVIPLIMVMMPLIRAAPPLMKWRTRRKIYRWYTQLRQIDVKLFEGMSKADAQKFVHRLSLLEQQVAYVEIPLSYMEEYYNLRVHIDHVIDRVNEILKGEG